MCIGKVTSSITIIPMHFGVANLTPQHGDYITRAHCNRVVTLNWPKTHVAIKLAWRPLPRVFFSLTRLGSANAQARAPKRAYGTARRDHNIATSIRKTFEKAWHGRRRLQFKPSKVDILLQDLRSNKTALVLVVYATKRLCEWHERREAFKRCMIYLTQFFMPKPNAKHDVILHLFLDFLRLRSSAVCRRETLFFLPSCFPFDLHFRVKGEALLGWLETRDPKEWPRIIFSWTRSKVRHPLGLKDTEHSALRQQANASVKMMEIPTVWGLKM